MGFLHLPVQVGQHLLFQLSDKTYCAVPAGSRRMAASSAKVRSLPPPSSPALSWSLAPSQLTGPSSCVPNLVYLTGTMMPSKAFLDAPRLNHTPQIPSFHSFLFLKKEISSIFRTGDMSPNVQTAFCVRPWPAQPFQCFTLTLHPKILPPTGGKKENLWKRFMQTP